MVFKKNIEKWEGIGNKVEFLTPQKEKELEENEFQEYIMWIEDEYNIQFDTFNAPFETALSIYEFFIKESKEKFRSVYGNIALYAMYQLEERFPELRKRIL